MLTKKRRKCLIFTGILTVLCPLLSGKAMAGDHQMLVPSMEPRVYLSTRAEGGGATDSFESLGEIFAFVALGERLGKKGDVMRAEWIRPDGESQEVAAVTLKETLFPGQHVRFWIRFNPEGGSLVDDIRFRNGGDSGLSGEGFEGAWMLKVFLNDSELKTMPFTISSKGLESQHNKRGGL